MLLAPTSKSTGRSTSRLPVDFTSTGSLEEELLVDLEVGPVDFAQFVNRCKVTIATDNIALEH